MLLLVMRQYFVVVGLDLAYLFIIISKDYSY